MEKVKVSRYKPGKRPEYAPSSSSEEEEEEEPVEVEGREEEPVGVVQELLEYSTADVMVQDKRLQRLHERVRVQVGENEAEGRSARTSQNIPWAAFSGFVLSGNTSLKNRR